MKRVTLYIPDGVHGRLRDEAERRGVTVADLSRDAIDAYLSVPITGRRLGAAGAGRSGRADVSERIEEILAGEVR